MASFSGGDSIFTCEEHTVANTVDEIYQIQESFIRRFPISQAGQRFLYRGQSNHEWHLTPSLTRSPEVNEASTLEHLNIPLGTTDLFDHIAKLQHYEQPTRFLDYSTNIDISLYFACCAEYENDGKLFITNYSVRNPEWKDTVMICLLSSLDKPTTIIDFVERLFVNYPSHGFDDLDDLIMRLKSFLIHGFAVVPTEDDYERMNQKNMRIARQKGAFFVCGNKVADASGKKVADLRRPANLPLGESYSYFGSHLILPELSDVPKTMYRPLGTIQVIIPARIKPEIILHLATKGIGQEYLFALSPHPM